MIISIAQSIFLIYKRIIVIKQQRFKLFIIIMSCESQPLLSSQEKDITSSEKTSQFQHLQGISQPDEIQVNNRANSPKDESQELQWIISQGKDSQFQRILHVIAQKISNKDCNILVKNKILHHRLIKLFYKVVKGADLEKESQSYALFLLSLLAEIVRMNPLTKLPFTKKIVQSILSIDIDSLQSIQNGQKIMKIISILMSNMAQQGKMIQKLGVVQLLWKSLNLLFSKADDYFVLRILLKAFLQLAASANITLSSQSSEVISITSKVAEIFGIGTATKIKVRLVRSKSKISSEMTLQDLVSNKK